jgi:hypothetical protein
MFGSRHTTPATTGKSPSPTAPAAAGNGHGNHEGNGNGAGAVTTTPGQDAVKRQVHNRLLETLDLVQARRMPREQLQAECSRRVDQLLGEQKTSAWGRLRNCFAIRG